MTGEWAMEDWNEEQERLAMEEIEAFERDRMAELPPATIRRRWSPELDVHVRLIARTVPFRPDVRPLGILQSPTLPWRIVLPVDLERSPHIEYAATWADALAIALFWAFPTRTTSTESEPSK